MIHKVLKSVLFKFLSIWGVWVCVQVAIALFLHFWTEYLIKSGSHPFYCSGRLQEVRLPLPITGVTGAHCHAWLYVGAGDSKSGSHAYQASTADWSSSPVLEEPRLSVIDFWLKFALVMVRKNTSHDLNPLHCDETCFAAKYIAVLEEVCALLVFCGVFQRSSKSSSYHLLPY